MDHIEGYQVHANVVTIVDVVGTEWYSMRMLHERLLDRYFSDKIETERSGKERLFAIELMWVCTTERELTSEKGPADASLYLAHFE